MKRFARIAFWLVILLFWLAVIALGLEAYDRVWGRAEAARGLERANEMLGMGWQVTDSWLKKHPAPLPPAGWRGLPPLEEAITADARERERIAGERREMILSVKRDGAIAARHVGGEPAEVLAIAERFRPGANLTEALPEAEGADAMNCVQSVYAGDSGFERSYHLELPGEQLNCFSFTFLGDRDNPGEALISVANSPWLEQGVRFRPNFYQENFNETQDFWTNSRGFRSEEVVTPKPAGVFRIACVGGSTTAKGPRNDLTYPAMLQRRLREHFGSDAIEVVNCGVYALDSRGESERLPDYLALDLDLLLHYNFVNDVSTLLLWDNGNLLFSRTPWLNEAKKLLWESSFMRNRMNGFFLPPEADMKQRIGELSISHLEEMGDAIRARGGFTAVSSFAYPHVGAMSRIDQLAFEHHARVNLERGLLKPKSYNRMVQWYNELVRELCEREGYLYLPVAENLDAGLEMYSDMCHFFVNGMDEKARIMAEGLIPFIERHWEGARQAASPAMEPAS